MAGGWLGVTGVAGVRGWRKLRTLLVRTLDVRHGYTTFLVNVVQSLTGPCCTVAKIDLSKRMSAFVTASVVLAVSAICPPTNFTTQFERTGNFNLTAFMGTRWYVQQQVRLVLEH